MKHIIFIALVLSFKGAISQPKDTLEIELSQLVYKKVEYEKFETFAKRNASRFSAKRDSAYAVYLAQIKKIKQNPAQYLKYINERTQQPETKKERTFYSYFNTALPFDPNEYSISKYDLYRVIKRSLLEENAAELPETLDDISIPIKRGYYPNFKLQRTEDILVDDRKTKSHK